MNFSGTLRINKFACFTLVFVLFVIVYWQSGGHTYPTESSDLVNLKTLMKGAILAAEMGGLKVNRGIHEDLNVKIKGKTKEGAVDPVTDADYASHCVMYYSLLKTFPKIKVISEEHSKGDSSCTDQQALDVDSSLIHHREVDMMFDEHVYTKDVTIWIDPLDATKEYTEGLYKYVTTMVCVAVKGIPILGVIHYPFTPDTYWGWNTKKTSNNFANVHYKEDNKQHPHIVVSRSHPGRVSEIAKEAFGPDTMITSAAGAGYKVIAVANGTYDMYLHATAIKKWDICAGDAIIRTLNGKMTTGRGQLIQYDADSPFKVTDGILVARFDHDYYLSKMPKIMTALP